MYLSSGIRDVLAETCRESTTHPVVSVSESDSAGGVDEHQTAVKKLRQSSAATTSVLLSASDSRTVLPSSITDLVIIEDS